MPLLPADPTAYFAVANARQKIFAYIKASVYNNYRDEQSSGESYRISGTDKRVFRCDGYYQEAMQQHSLLCYGGIMSKRFNGFILSHL